MTSEKVIDDYHPGMGAFGYWLYTDLIDEDAVEFFTWGQCWALAEVMEQTFGWNIFVERWPDQGDGEEEYAWSHVLAEYPDSHYLVDINGFYTRRGDPDYLTLNELGRSFPDLARECAQGVTKYYYRRRSLEVARAFLPTLLDLMYVQIQDNMIPNPYVNHGGPLREPPFPLNPTPLLDAYKILGTSPSPQARPV